MSSNDREPTAPAVRFEKDDDGTHVYLGDEFVGKIRTFPCVGAAGWASNDYGWQDINGDGWYGAFRSRKACANALILAHQGLVREEGR